MSRSALIGLVAVIIMTGGMYLSKRQGHNLSMTKQTSPPSESPQSSPPPSPGDNFQPGQTSSNSSSTSVSVSSHSSTTVNGSTAITPVNVLVTVDANSGNQTITITQGAQVSLTFRVVGATALEFKSSDPALDTGIINPGGSKTIQFTASKTFSFNPYANGQKRGFIIAVTVN